MEYIANNCNVISLDSVISDPLKTDLSRNKRVAITFDDGWEDNYSCAFSILKHYGLSATFFIITELITEEIHQKNREEMKPLTIDQIIEMNLNGMNFGSHTCTHPNLCEIDLDCVRHELLYSKEMLEEVLGFPVDTFCYPFGCFNSKIIELLKNTGYKLACATSWGGCDREVNPFALPRIRIDAQDQIQDFIDKIEGDWDYIRAIKFVRDKMVKVFPINCKEVTI